MEYKNETLLKITKFFEKVPEFENFLTNQKINFGEYCQNLLNYKQKGIRFIRLKPNLKFSEIEKFEQQMIQLKLEKSFLKNVYSLPKQVNINNLDFYQNNILYGIELGSILAVNALDPQPGENILDICCAPGAKLMYISDIIQNKDNQKSIIVGNDISYQRLNVCRNLLKKYQKENLISLINCDAKELNISHFSFQFDKIIADVECSHDGSLKHILKFIFPPQKQIKEKIKKTKNISNREKKRRENQKSNSIKTTWDSEGFKSRVLQTHQIKELQELQINILTQSISLVKKEGIVIYSTCSLSQTQNEDVIQIVLQKFQNKITLLNLFEEWKNIIPQLQEYGIKEGNLPGTIRMNPSKKNCGAIFIAKLKSNQLLLWNRKLKITKLFLKLFYKVSQKGDSNVGKTNILTVYTDQLTKDTTTIAPDLYTKILEIDKKTIKLQIWDTAGQEKYRALTKNMFKDIDGVIYIYDITNKESFQHIEFWMNEMSEQTQVFSSILIGNKKDLIETRQVNSNDGIKFAEEKQMMFFETTITFKESIQEAFEMLAKCFLKRNFINERRRIKKNENLIVVDKK